MTKDKMYQEAEDKALAAVKQKGQVGEYLIHNITSRELDMEDDTARRYLYTMCKQYVADYERAEEKLQAAWNIAYALSQIDE